MNRIVLNSFRTKLIFVALLFCVLFSLAGVHAADNQTGNVLCGSDTVTDEIVMDTNFDGSDSRQTANVLCGSDAVTDEIVMDTNFDESDSQDLKVVKASKSNLKASVIDVNRTVDPSCDLNTLQKEINNCTDDEYKMTRNYTYDWRNDDIKVINITRDNFTIDGQGHTIDGDIGAKFFHITGENITLKNINFVRGVNPEYKGLKTFGVVNINGTGAKVLNCNFTDNGDDCSVALCLEDAGYISGCNFINNHGCRNGGAVLLRSGGIIDSSYFINNTVASGGIISTYGDLILQNTRFDRNVCLLEKNNNNDIYNGGSFNVTILFTDFKQLNQLINQCAGNVLTLSNDFIFNPEIDSSFKSGIEINRDNFVIDGAGHSIDGANLARIFNVTGNNVTFKNISFLNGIANEGGAIYAQNVLIKSCIFSGNTALNDGGAVYINKSGSVENSTFANNSAEYNGGAVYARNLTLSGSNLENNTASYGGGIFTDNVTVDNSTFTGNLAYNSGGGISIKENGTVKNTNFTGNCAKNMHGGSVFMANVGSLDNCRIRNSTAGKNGGGIYAVNGTVKNSLFMDCNAKFNGGAVFVLGNGSVIGSTFLENNAGAGGGVYLCDAASLLRNIFTLNHANLVGDNLYHMKEIRMEGNYGI